MKTIQHTALIALFAFGVSLGSAQAQQPPDPHVPEVPQEQVPPAEEVQEAVQLHGELVQVDADAGTLTVKDAEGNETEFRYTDLTEVTGAETGTAGLATLSGSAVTVHYVPSEYAVMQTATRIDIAPGL
jgi:hypothetical protein